jgi:hypothetical protein
MGQNKENKDKNKDDSNRTDKDAPEPIKTRGGTKGKDKGGTQGEKQRQG